MNCSFESRKTSTKCRRFLIRIPFTSFTIFENGSSYPLPMRMRENRRRNDHQLFSLEFRQVTAPQGQRAADQGQRTVQPARSVSALTNSFVTGENTSGP